MRKFDRTTDFLGPDNHMKTTIIAILILLLVATKTLWLYLFIDGLTVKKYQVQEQYQLDAARARLMGMLPELAKEESKEAVIAAAVKYDGSTVAPYEKEGCTWVGWVGLKFSNADRLEHVSRAWSDGSPDPCHPDSLQ
jgi:hypothetical protein